MRRSHWKITWSGDVSLALPSPTSNVLKMNSSFLRFQSSFLSFDNLRLYIVVRLQEVLEGLKIEYFTPFYDPLDDEE